MYFSLFNFSSLYYVRTLTVLIDKYENDLNEILK